jgi:nicotinamide/nicotinate riboside kinase
VVVGIGGATRAGKSTLVCHLHQIIPNSIVIHQDSFFFENKPAVRCRNVWFFNWDNPNAIDFEKFTAKILETKKKMTQPCLTCQKKTPDLKSNVEHREIDQNSMKTDSHNNNSTSRHFIFVEGFLIYVNLPHYDFQKLFDYKFFITINRELCYKRR